MDGLAAASAARCRGTPPRSAPTSRSRSSSGTSGSSPISRRCAIAPPSAGDAGSTASSRSAGAARLAHWQPLPGRLRAPRRASRRRSCVSVHTIVSMRLRDHAAPRLALDDLPAVLRRGRDLLRLRDGAHAHHPGPAPLRLAERRHRRGTSRTWRRCCSCTGWIVTYAYVVEMFSAWYCGDPYERYVHLFNRPFGAYAFFVWLSSSATASSRSSSGASVRDATRGSCSLRRSLINVGMWLERFNLIVTSLQRDFLPSSWALLRPVARSTVDLSSARCPSSSSSSCSSCGSCRSSRSAS